MANGLSTTTEYTPEQRAQLLHDFQRLVPLERQTQFVTALTESGVTDPNVIAAKMQSVIVGQQLTAAMGIAGPRPTEQQATREAALVALGQNTAQVEQLVAQGKSADQIVHEVKADKAEVLAIAQPALQQKQQEEKLQDLAKADEVHRDKTQAQPQPEAHALAALVPDHLRAAIQSWNTPSQGGGSTVPGQQREHGGGRGNA